MEQTTSYISPKTGSKYLVVPKQYAGVAYDAQRTKLPGSYYEIVFRGNPIARVGSRSQVPNVIKTFENPAYE
jgi:hypothetical protein